MARDVRYFDILENEPPTFSLLLKKKKYCEAFISGMWHCLTKKNHEISGIEQFSYDINVQERW